MDSLDTRPASPGSPARLGGAPAPVPLRADTPDQLPAPPGQQGASDASLPALPVDRSRSDGRPRRLTAAPLPGDHRGVQAELWTALLAVFVHRYTGDTTVSLVTAPDRAAVIEVRSDDTLDRVVTATLAACAKPAAVQAGSLAGNGVLVTVAQTADLPPDAVGSDIGLGADLDFDADLALVVTPEGPVLIGNTALWDEASVARMAGHLAQLASDAEEHPSAAVEDLALLSAAERRKLVVDLNATAATWPSEGYLDLVSGHATRTPDQLAVLDGSSALTFGELEARSNQIASRLARAGVHAGTRVGVLSPRSAAFVAGVLGILKCGAAVALLDPANPDDRLALIHSDAAPVLVLAAAGLSSRLPAGTATLDLETAGLDEPVTRPPIPPAGPDTVTHLVYTSGSTGRPKAVLERHEALVNLVHWTGRAYGVRPGDRASWTSAPGFAVQLMEWMPYLGLGVTVCIAEPAQIDTPERIRDWLLEQRVTHTMLVAPLADRVSRLDWPADTPLRVMVTTAERLHRWPPADTPFRVVMTYGSTETTNALSCLDLGAGVDLTSHATTEEVRGSRPVPAGRPIANVRAYILDDARRPVPPGVVGTLSIAGAGLAAGYHGQPDLTVGKFPDNPVAEEPAALLCDTGDLARMRGDGAIEVLGRVDAQVKIRGYRVELGEVEAALLAVDGVEEAVVLGQDAGPGDRRLAGYVGAPGDGLSPAAVRAELSRRLPDYMVPGSITVLRSLPRLANGKVDRVGLPATAAPEARAGLDTPYVAPRTGVEIGLATIWQEVLACPQVGVHDGFFELGGHSLLAFDMISRIQQRYGVELGLPDLITAPTIAGLAVLVADREAQQATAGLPPIVPDPAGKYEPFPLNDSQQALWIGRGDDVELGNVGCHGYFEWENPDLDVERFDWAWRALVDRHDALRTVVTSEGVQQVLLELPEYSIPVLDLRQASPDEVNRQLLEVREHLSHQVIPDDQWPLFDLRLTLLPSPPDTTRVRIHLSLDMLIADAWSYFQVLIPDLVALYSCPERKLAPLRLTFRDYVVGAERALERSEAYRRSEQYWQQRLGDLPPAPSLPSRPAWQPVLPMRFERVDHCLDTVQWNRLKARANAAGLTPSCVLTAAFAEVLREWTGQNRFTINFPLFNRLNLHPEVNSIIGDTTTTLLLAVEEAGGAFADRAVALQRQLWSDLEHRHYSGVRVLRDLARNRGSVAAAMPVVLTSLLGHPPRHFATELGEAVYTISQTPQVSLDFQVFEIAGELQFNWDFLPPLFPDGLVEDMFGAYCRLLHDLTDDPDAWQQQHVVVLPERQRALRATVNDTAAPVRDVLLHELLFEQAKLRPNAPAVISARRTLDFGELSMEAKAVSAGLVDAGVRPGDVVAVVMDRGWEQYAAVYGTLAAGAAYLPIDPEVPAQRLRTLLDAGGAAVALTQPWLAGRLDWPAGVRPLTVSPAPTAAPAAAAPAPAHRGRPTDLAYILYTSGSTGEPKGVAVEHRAVVNLLDDARRRFALGPADRVLATAALNFDLSVTDLFTVLAAGGGAVLPSPGTPDPAELLELIQRHEVTFWGPVPALAQLLVDQGEAAGAGPLRSLRAIVMSGDWIPLDLPGRLRALVPGLRVVGSGGPTETVVWSVVNEIGEVDPRWTSIPYGTPMTNHRLHVLSPQRRERPLWVVGEIYDSGDAGLARGYWRDPERTAQAFVQLPETGHRAYASGDLGRYLPDGSIQIIGRADSQVKVRGHRIELGEVEAALRTHPDVQAAVAVAVGEHAARRLVAHVVPVRQPGPAEQELREHVAAILPAACVPAAVVLRQSLPLSDNGKVDRRALAMLDVPRPVHHQPAPTADMTELELMVAEMWQEILGIEKVGPADSFFDLGGDSMAGARVARKLTERLGVRIPLRVIFDLPRVSDVAAELERATAARSTAGTAANV